MRYAPWEKLLEAFVLILAGGTAMNQIDTILRPDTAVQLAFGLTQCAHSSGVQRTLDACSFPTVASLQQANERLYHRYGRALHQDCSQDYLLLDLDVTGLLAGQQAEESAKGYFANHRGGYGRQLCRVVVTASHEILCQALLPGNTLSKATLKPAIRHAVAILGEVASCHSDLLFRWDAGFGTDQNINWMLTQNYQILGKMYSQTRVRKLARSVTRWRPTPSSPGRELGRLPHPHRFARRTTQLAVRTPKKHPSGAWAYGILVTTLHHLPADDLVTLYDERGGGIESDFRSDRQGLGLATRRKHRLAAQYLLLLLAERAHNVLVWTTDQFASPLTQFGMLRLVRDAFQVDGYLLLQQSTIVEIGLNRRHPYAHVLQKSFNRLLNGMPQLTLWDPIEVSKNRKRSS